jgi:hypothetical protein
MPRTDWGLVIDEAREIVEGYETPVTLRQLYYRLVARQFIPNQATAYKRLSALTAGGRRAGTFPELSDRTRAIHCDESWTSPTAALGDLASWYRRDRTEGQDVSLYLAVEKNGLVAQLRSWFGDLGVPVLALGGYASQSYVRGVVEHVAAQSRGAVLLYAGDHDPSGWDIPRDFTERTGCWKHVERVALTPEQVAEYSLPEAMGKETDSRSTGFAERFGRLTQVEVDALAPDALRGLFAEAVGQYWDMSAYRLVLGREEKERAALSKLATRG